MLIENNSNLLMCLPVLQLLTINELRCRYCRCDVLSNGGGISILYEPLIPQRFILE
jgi:hypothetical protein